MTTPVDDYHDPRADLRSRRSDPAASGSGSTSATTRRGPTARARCVSATPAQIGTFSQKPFTTILNYNVTGQITSSLRGRFAASNQRDEGGYALPNSGPDGVSTSNPALFPVGHPPRQLERFVLRRPRLGRQQPHLRQRDDDALQDRPTRRRHVQRRAAAHVPGVELPVPRDSRVLQKINGFADNPSSSRFVRGGLSRFNFNADVTRYGQLARPAHAQGRLPDRTHRRRHAVGRAGGDRAAVLGPVLRAQRRPPPARRRTATTTSSAS